MKFRTEMKIAIILLLHANIIITDGFGNYFYIFYIIIINYKTSDF